MKRAILLVLAAAFAGGLTACNTVSGVGRDVSDVGRGISASSRAVEREIR
jgi:predicted small secreted protein